MGYANNSVMTTAEAQGMVEEVRGYELAEARLNKRPVDPGKPYTQAHLREVLVDAQMRLAGAANFGHALVLAGEWTEADFDAFDSDCSDAAMRVQSLYRNLR